MESHGNLSFCVQTFGNQWNPFNSMCLSEIMVPTIDGEHTNIIIRSQLHYFTGL